MKIPPQAQSVVRGAPRGLSRWLPHTSPGVVAPSFSCPTPPMWWCPFPLPGGGIEQVCCPETDTSCSCTGLGSCTCIP